MLRHSTAHVMAQAVTQLFPGAKFSIGPAIENGFYYDFELPGGATFSDDDLVAIEARMREIVKADQPFVRSELSADQARGVFADQPYKVEIIERVRELAANGATDALDAGEVDAGETVSVYRNSDEFVDLCKGPHVPSTGRLGHFKLQKVAGAYWRGNEKGPMLQRIYGTAWSPTPRYKRISTSLSRPRSATTAGWEPNSTCSASRARSAAAWPSGPPRAPSCAS